MSGFSISHEPSGKNKRLLNILITKHCNNKDTMSIDLLIYFQLNQLNH